MTLVRGQSAASVCALSIGRLKALNRPEWTVLMTEARCVGGHQILVAAWARSGELKVPVRPG
jgi:hypothetical protein